MSKIDILRQEVRRSEKVRRDLESRLEESVTEVNNERKLREKNEEICHQVCIILIKFHNSCTFDDYLFLV